MELMGTVQNGVVVLENAPLLKEGTRVRIVVEPTEEEGKSLRDFLRKHAGTAQGLPSDMAEQHDHYIHGTPRR